MLEGGPIRALVLVVAVCAGMSIPALADGHPIGLVSYGLVFAFGGVLRRRRSHA